MTMPRAVELELRDVDFSQPQETLRRGSRLISPKVGLIRAVGHGVFFSQDPETFAMGILAPDLSRFTEIANTSKAGGGGETMEIALAATIGEAVERYAMYFYDPEEMVFGSFRQLGTEAIHPEQARLYSHDQVVRANEKGIRRDFFDEDSEIRWVRAYSLTSKCSRLVPASLVYMNYAYKEGEAAIGRNASTGLAASLTLEEAILSGLSEVIERDSFTISWLHQTAGPKLKIDDAKLTATMEESFQANHPAVDLRIFDTTLDIPVPSVFGMMRRPAEFGQALCVGSVVRTDPRAAVQKCLREIGQGIPYFRYLMPRLADWEPRQDHTDLVAFDHHCMLYVKRPELVEKNLRFYLEIDEELNLSDFPAPTTGRALADIELCVQLLAERGWEVIVADLTTPDIAEVGFRVVRVMVPGLVPLHGNHNWPYLGVSRLYEIPKWLEANRPGWSWDGTLNQNPHPFP